MSNSRDIDRELAALIYKQTKNENFTRNICMFMDTDEQKKELIQFIKENNPTLTEINHRSFEMVMEKLALHTCDWPREDPPRIIGKGVYEKNSMSEMQIRKCYTGKIRRSQ